MAIEKRNPFGEITGTLGNVVRRKRFGKIVVSLRPSKYRKSKSKLAVAGRNSFALSVSLAKAVNKIPQLKQVWQIAKLEGVVAYNRIIKYNKKFIKDDLLTTQNIITPVGVPMLLDDFKIYNKSISFKIILNNNRLKKLLKDSFHLHLVFYLFDPKNSKKKSFSISSQSKIVEQLPLNNTLIIKFNFVEIIQKYFNNYNILIVYVAATNFKCNKKELFWTNTVAKQFNI